MQAAVTDLSSTHVAGTGRREIVSNVVAQHVEDVAILHATRSALASAPHVQLHHLRRFDDRIAAHLDGLSIADEGAWPLCERALELLSPGVMFTATLQAIQSKRQERLDRLLALAQSAPEAARGMRAAFGWLEPDELRGVVAALLASDDPYRRAIGVAACGMHRVDPALGPARRFDDPDPLVRARAFRTAGELGQREFVSRLGASIGDTEVTCAFWAAWSAVMLGDRHNALQSLSETASTPGVFRARAFQVSLLAMPLAQAHELLRALAREPAQIRWLIKGTGLAGDTSYLPWLMNHMGDDKLARLAGEAFSLVTGVDLAALDLERKPPENFESGPNDNPNDANVEMDEDDDLPWPDAERIQRWWSQNGSRFVSGQRYFVGAPVTREHCIEVLKTGYQRQRILAAYHLCLLEPGSVLFEWRAPVWRQAQALAALG